VGKDDTRTILGTSLESLLPSVLAGFKRHSTTSVYQHELEASEVLGSYVGPSGNSLLLSIADLGSQPKLYRNFLTGGGLRQTSSGNSFGLAFRQASLQGSANYGLILGQVSPAYLGQPPGVLGMAQSSQAI
jgi:hypothetical protein